MIASRLEADKELIRAAMSYRSGPDTCNSVYMGSISTAGAYRKLGLTYGEGGFEAALVEATPAQVNSLIEHCAQIIDYMEKHPMILCPCCKQVVATK